MAALVNHTCLALLILPENLHHICFHFFASQISSNDFCYLKAYSNVLQHVSVCENPCNTKSLYCLCLYTDFCNRGAFISVYFFMWAMQMWRLWSSWGLARRPRLLYMPDILCFLCIPLWALLFYSIMTLLICVQCVTCLKAADPYLWYCWLPRYPPPLTALQFISSMGRDLHLPLLNSSLFISVHLSLFTEILLNASPAI